MRMATIVLTLRACGEQIVKPFLIFKGGGHLDADILAELDKYGIRYDFNADAWADGLSCLTYLRYFHDTVRKHAPSFKEHLLFLDGMSSQATKQYMELALLTCCSL